MINRMENEKCESPSILRIMTQGLGKSKVLIPVFLGTRSVRKNFNERVSYFSRFREQQVFRSRVRLVRQLWLWWLVCTVVFVNDTALVYRRRDCFHRVRVRKSCRIMVPTRLGGKIAKIEKTPSQKHFASHSVWFICRFAFVAPRGVLHSMYRKKICILMTPTLVDH